MCFSYQLMLLVSWGILLILLNARIYVHDYLSSSLLILFFFSHFFTSNYVDWVPLCCNCYRGSGVKCYWLFCVKACSYVGAHLVLSNCQCLYHRDELQPYAKFCWILPSTVFRWTFLPVWIYHNIISCLTLFVSIGLFSFFLFSYAFHPSNFKLSLLPFFNMSNECICLRSVIFLSNSNLGNYVKCEPNLINT